MIFAKKISKIIILTCQNRNFLVPLRQIYNSNQLAFAQHVTPLSFRVADVNLDSLRTLYQAQPTMYRASLDVIAKQLSQNASDIKAAKAQLKVEQAHAKERGNSIKEATKMASSLKKTYSQEEKTLKSMQKTVEKQQRTVNKQMGLNQETRDSYLAFLEQQQRELGYALREVAERLRAVAELETSIQNGQTDLQSYIQETQQKATDLALFEAQHKERTALIKAEQKSAKSMQ